MNGDFPHFGLEQQQFEEDEKTKAFKNFLKGEKDQNSYPENRGVKINPNSDENGSIEDPQ